MSEKTLSEVAKYLAADGKGILAADESSGSIKIKLTKSGVEDTFENRRLYREIFFTATEVEKYLSGVIMFDETIRQVTSDGIPFPQLLASKGVIPGIKVDIGVIPVEGSEQEKFAHGVEALPSRMQEYYDLGARFAKWRAIIYIIGDGIPTDKCIEMNMDVLARYAKICQDFKIVPIVEPEILMDGNHTIERCFEVTKKCHDVLFAKLRELGVNLSELVLKPNMVMYSTEGEKVSAEVVAQKTIECFSQSVPAEVPSIVFLSGGQSEPEACANLSAIAKLSKEKNTPWTFSFSFGRGLQNTAVHTWVGKAENFVAAQQAFLHRAKLASAAAKGEYTPEME